jgi:hypothetical protein
LPLPVPVGPGEAGHLHHHRDLDVAAFSAAAYKLSETSYPHIV